MIKLWKGIEKEGVRPEAEVKTLFVSADEKISYDFLYTFLKDDLDIRSIYFGAGRKRFEGVLTTTDWDKIVSYCADNKISIVIEVAPGMLNEFVTKYNDVNVTFIVAYYNAPKNINNLYFKTDDYFVTKIFTVVKEVDITSVDDDRYLDDELIYMEV